MLALGRRGDLTLQRSKHQKKKKLCLVFGHFHTSWARKTFDGQPEFGEGADFSPYYGDGFIGLDGCTAYTGKVNVVVLEDKFL